MKAFPSAPISTSHLGSVVPIPAGNRGFLEAVDRDSNGSLRVQEVKSTSPEVLVMRLNDIGAVNAPVTEEGRLGRTPGETIEEEVARLERLVRGRAMEIQFRYGRGRI